MIEIEIKARGFKIGTWCYWDRNGNNISELEYQESGNTVKEDVKFLNLSIE